MPFNIFVIKEARNKLLLGNKVHKLTLCILHIYDTRCISLDAASIITQACVVNQLDYCNVLYCGKTDGLMSHLQSVLNIAARLITGLGGYTWTTRLLVRQCVHFKLAIMVFHSFAGHTSLISLRTANLTLVSSNMQTSIIQHACSMHIIYGERPFDAARPRFGSLPVHLRQPDIHQVLQAIVKHFFQ